MGNRSLGWKIFGLFVSIGLIIGGLSGEFVLRGTESSSALIVVGFLFLIWDIIAIATHKKQQEEPVEENDVDVDVDVEANAEPQLAASNLTPEANRVCEVVNKQVDASFTPPPKLNGIQWFIRAVWHFADFNGRARRREYWMFTLFNIIFYFAWSIMTGVIFALSNAYSETGLTVALYGYFVMMMLPGMAVTVRRLHDIGKSGWMILVGLIPLVGGIWLLILMLTEGDLLDNKYGPNPKTRHEPLSENTKLKNTALTLMVAASLYILMLVIRMIVIYVENNIFFYANLLLVVAGILLLLAGKFLLSEQSMHDLREKGKQALLLVLISVAIFFLTELYFLSQNFGFYGWIQVAGSFVHILLYFALGFMLATLLFLQQYRYLVSKIAACILVLAGLQIVSYVFNILSINGGGAIMVFVGVFYFLLPVSLIILTANYLLQKNESTPASIPLMVHEHARVTTPRISIYGQKPFYMLEHTIGSRYHHAGELQKIVADQVVIGRDPTCEVRFDENFETVSRRHATIIKDGNDWKFVPLSQTNSTFINGQIVHSAWYLQDGDEIQCAVNGPKLVFRTGAVNL